GGNSLASLTTNVGGTTFINGGAVTTSGAQSYGDAVQLGTNTTLASTGNGNITLAAVDGAAAATQSLTVNTGGTTTFGGVVGGTNSLATLTTDAGGTTSALSVTTSGNQGYGDPLTTNGTYTTTANGTFTASGTTTLAGNTTVSTGSGNVTFTGAVDGAAA